jgi:hypothetical protein
MDVRAASHVLPGENGEELGHALGVSARDTAEEFSMKVSQFLSAVGSGDGLLLIGPSI